MSQQQRQGNTQGQPQQRSNDNGKIVCQICGKMNHLAIDCWYRFDYSYQSEEFPQALAALSFNDTNDHSFYVDSGATSHMTNDPGKLSSIKPYKGNDMIYVGDGNSLPISHIGDAHVSTKEGNFKLNNVLVVPELKKNLLSVGKFTSDNSCIFEFTSSGFVVKDRNQRTIARGHKKGQLYALDGIFHEAFSAIRKGGSTSSVWHQRLGHPSSRLLALLNERHVINITLWISKPKICVSCQMGKSCKLPFSNSNKVSKFPLDKIHCDL